FCAVGSYKPRWFTTGGGPGMAIIGIVKHVRRGVAAAAAVIIAGIWFSASAEAGVDSGAAVGIGLGSFALGTALGAASHPYYGPYYYTYGYYFPTPPPMYYHPPAHRFYPTATI